MMSRLPKSALVIKNGNMTVDAATLLKIPSTKASTASDYEDTVEITSADKKPDALEDKGYADDIVSYVSRRNKEIRARIPKPIPPEVAWSLINGDPNKKAELNRQKAIEAKLDPIVTKMTLGKKLSSQELTALKEYLPDKYMVAVRVEREREALERQLQRCNTKEEKMQVINQKKHHFASAAHYTSEKDEMGMLFIRAIFATIDEEVKHLDDA
jgi:hypothetical protein